MRQILADVTVSGHRADVELTDLPPQPLCVPGGGDDRDQCPVALTLQHDNQVNRGRRFVYFDVGRWGGDEDRYFGIIYGVRGENIAYIALCSYKPDWDERRDSISSLPYMYDNQTLCSRTVISFLNSCHGRIHTSGPIRGIDTSDNFYLLLGDLHLPLVNRRCREWREGRPIHFPCRVDTRYMEGLQPSLSEVFTLAGLSNLGLTDPISLSRPELWLPITARDSIGYTRFWWERYIDSDIFTAGTSNTAAEDLRAFLTLAHDWQGNNIPIHFVQLGDMYELWVGLKRFFEDTGDNYRIDLFDSTCPWAAEQCDSFGDYTIFACGPCPYAAEECYTINLSLERRFTVQNIINDWVSLVNGNTQITVDNRSISLAEWLHNDLAFSHKTWIYGNHDNYLRVLSTRLGLPERRMNLYENQILFEHGHQSDEYNRDGDVRGHAITQGGAFLWSLRTFENLYSQISSGRRHTFIGTSVKKLVTDPDLSDMKVYVMAHTHQPDLALVEIRSMGRS